MGSWRRRNPQGRGHRSFEVLIQRSAGGRMTAERKDREEPKSRPAPGVVEGKEAPSAESSEPTLIPTETILLASGSCEAPFPPPQSPTDPVPEFATITPRMPPTAPETPSPPTPSIQSTVVRSAPEATTPPSTTAIPA